ncbi:MAG: aminotransferase class I/II-fold pyridoxal phosphate-dependent enzyme [Archangium sp.]|nr:aminotransferase class I/II-fold pyridoxal phosphate-dependent enzyme [Archangium sp.]
MTGGEGTAQSARVASFGTTIFTEMSRLALASGAVNLGQGFPDFDGPEEIRDAAISAIRGGVNQYAITTGAVALREAVAAHATRFYGQTVDPASEVVVTSGATEAIFDTVMAFVDPGDEVVLFEPYYDSYDASVRMAGGVPKYVRLRAPDAAHARWWFDEAELAAAFSERTALVMLNTPHNPTGKVFTREEIALIGALVERFDAVLLSDEVYEHLVFEPAVHVRPATVGQVGKRTVTISSGGKSFSFTGWKIGWALGPAPLLAAVQKAHQWVTFATAAPFQAAIAKALALPDSYFSGFRDDYRRRHQLVANALAAAGFMPLPCEGTYFVIADVASAGFEDDVAFCRWLTTSAKVAAIPPSVFCSADTRPHLATLARFAFCKSDAVLEEGARRLATLPPRLR